jgi:hypothetical protein
MVDEVVARGTFRFRAGILFPVATVLENIRSKAYLLGLSLDISKSGFFMRQYSVKFKGSGERVAEFAAWIAAMTLEVEELE